MAVDLLDKLFDAFGAPAPFPPFCMAVPPLLTVDVPAVTSDRRIVWYSCWKVCSSLST